MKIKPLKKYPLPEYPTKPQMEENPELLENLPRRWTNSAKLAIIMGVGIMSRALAAASESGDEKSVGIVQLPPEAKAKDEAVPKVESQKDNLQNSIVAPVLAKALENDGRGAFGCVVVNPPTFLPEPEALEIIKTELEKSGLKLKEDVIVDGIASPNKNARLANFDGNGESKTEDDKEKFIIGKHTFDFASDDGRILIDFLSRKDYREWDEAGRKVMSSVQSYDYPKLVKTLSDEYGKYKSDDKKVFGIFFEPLAHNRSIGPDLTGIDDPELRKKAMDEYNLSRDKRYSSLQEKDKAKLREQVAFFVDYLKKNGYIGK